MEKNKDLEISLLDAPVGAVVDLVSWGSLSQEDIRKLTDVGIYLDLPLTVSSVTISGPVVVAISNVHVAIGRPVAKELKVLWNKEVDEYMKPGEKGVIKAFRHGLIEYRKRLLALGALPGTPFVVERVAPLGDPVEIKLRGSSISVRKGEIEILDVEPI